jgi:hypothetical protein
MQKFKAVYDRAAGKEPQQQEETEVQLDQQLLKQRRLEWLKEEPTIEYLQFQRNKLLELYSMASDAASCGEDAKAIRLLVKANMLKETIEYATRK